jgi:hypothetical protein
MLVNEETMTKTLTFEHFLLHSQVIRLYFHALRLCKKVEPLQIRRELQWYIRNEIEQHRHEHDIDKIKHLLSYAGIQLKQLETTVEISK